MTDHVCHLQLYHIPPRRGDQLVEGYAHGRRGAGHRTFSRRCNAHHMVSFLPLPRRQSTLPGIPDSHAEAVEVATAIKLAVDGTVPVSPVHILLPESREAA